MADLVTPVLGLVKPEVNGAQTENVWGFDLNANFDKIDEFARVANAIPEAPSDGVLYGRLNAAWAAAAPINSPVFTGNPVAPTPGLGDNDDTIATTSFVHSVVAGYAPLASPAFTGNPTAPTPAPGDNDTSIATTAFVTAFGIAAGAVLPSNTAPAMNGVANAGTSALYSRGDHTHPGDTSRVAKAGDTMTGALTISATTTSTSPATGALIVTGGVGVGGNVSLAGSVTMNLNQRIYPYYGSGTNYSWIGANNNGDLEFTTGTSSPAVRLTISGAGGGNVSVKNATASTSPTTGALTVAGGLGVGGTINGSSGLTLGGSLSMAAGQAINFGGNAVTYAIPGRWVYAADTHSFYNLSTNVSYMDLNAAGMYIPIFTPSTSPSTGALIVGGGAGIGGSLTVGQQICSYSGTLYLWNYNSDPNQSIMFLNANQSIYLHNTGANLSLNGVPLRLYQGGHVLSGNDWSLYGPNNSARLRMFCDNTNGWFQAPALQFTGPGGAPATSNFYGPDATSTVSGAVVVNGGIGVSGTGFVGGTLYTQGGRIINIGNNSPCLALYQPGGGYSTGIYGSLFNLNFGNFDGNGNAINRHGFFQSDGIFNIGAGAYKPGGGAWSDSSDARIKNVLGTYDNGLASILSLNPVLYTFKGNDTPEAPASEARTFPGRKDASTREVAPYANSPHYQAAVEAKEFVGVIAQEAEVAFPRMVTQKDGFIDGAAVTDLRDIDTTPLIYALVNAVKELTARLEALEGAP
jgi:hypothetical protein